MLNVFVNEHTITVARKIEGDLQSSHYVRPLKNTLIGTAGSLEYVDDCATFSCCTIAYDKSRLGLFGRGS